MVNVNVPTVLSKIYGVRGLPFPKGPKSGNDTVTVNGFNLEGSPQALTDKYGSLSTPFIKVEDGALGRYAFMPVWFDGIELPNALIIINGEKEIIKTDLIEVGTVYEKSFTKPYSISVICTLVGQNDVWPEDQLKEMVALWKKDDLITVKCALTDLFLEPKNNVILTNVAVLDNQGCEYVEVVQFDGLSNVEFELEMK